ncbi:MAG TPA: hypothetical protein VGR56_06340 [Nitrososphaerales archaeon]|nr:hypothetical protein [Nitrososphaerales archaeon]
MPTQLSKVHPESFSIVVVVQERLNGLTGQVRVFAAYQFQSEHYDREKLEKTVDRAVDQTQKRISKRYGGLRIVRLRQRDIPNAQNVGEWVKGKLETATLTIFELSDENPSVMFELGYSMGLSVKKYSNGRGYDILMKTGSFRSVPSDLLGAYILKYPDLGESEPRYPRLEDALTSDLTTRIDDLFTDRNFLGRQIWKLADSTASIICSYVKPSLRPDIQSASGEYGDLLAVNEAGLYLQDVLNCKVDTLHSNEASTTHGINSRNLVVIGGPALNQSAEALMKKYQLPFEYRWTLRGKEDDSLVDRLAGTTYRTNSKGVLASDFGIFAVLLSIYKRDRTIILVSGITSLGGLGALEAFTNVDLAPGNYSALVKKAGIDGYFACLVQSDIESNRVTPRPVRGDTIYIFDPKNGTWSG